MPPVETVYNAIAGKNRDRLEALSDGIFAVAFTILVLDLRLPQWHAGATEADLLHGMRALLPSLVPYVLTFMTLGIFWIGQQVQLNALTRSDRNLAWLHLAFLLAVTLMPFTTRLLAEWITYRIALVEYWANIFVLGAMLFATLNYSARARLLKDEVGPDLLRAARRRILSAQALYAFGAALCVFNTYVSIAFIVFVQLNYVISPKFSPIARA